LLDNKNAATAIIFLKKSALTCSLGQDLEM